VSLTITVSGPPGRAAQHWTLTCDPAGGTHPHPAAACADLLRTKRPFAPQPMGMECPMIMASSKVAVIQGTYFGDPVNSTIRDGGCTLSRWAQLGQVIG
jgi:subtilisin inhibitor-like